MPAQVHTHRLRGAFHAATIARVLLSAAYRPPFQYTLPHGGNRPLLSAGVFYCLKLKGPCRESTNSSFGIVSRCPQDVQHCKHSCIRCEKTFPAQGARSSAAGSEDHAHVQRRGRSYAFASEADVWAPSKEARLTPSQLWRGQHGQWARRLRSDAEDLDSRHLRQNVVWELAAINHGMSACQYAAFGAAQCLCYKMRY